MQTPASADPPKKKSERPPPPTLVGSVLSGRYRLEKVLGEGGMGAVYLAEHTLMRKRMAVKVLHPELTRVPEVLARFEREAMAAAHIDHPNVAAATDFVKAEDGSYFLVLEYVEGQSLRDAIAAGPMPPKRAVHIASQIVAALARAHALGIVHRDLKPENVILAPRDEDPDFVKVLDFGIARVPMGDDGTPGSSLTKAGMVYGTPEYMAPEQALGQPVDGRADFYAVGIMLFEMVSGRRPFEDESKVKLLGKHLTAPVPSLRERAPVSPELEALIEKLLAKDAKDRFAEAKDLLAALAAVPLEATPRPPSSASLSNASATVVEIPTPLKQMASEAKQLTPRFLAVAGGAAALLLIFVVLVVVVVVRSKSSTNASTDGGAVTASASSAPPADDLHRADALVQSGDREHALAILQTMQAKEPKRPDVAHRLFALYNERGEDKAAMAAGTVWLDGDPSAKGDDVLIGGAKRAATGKDAPDAAITILEQSGPKGIDALYDLAYASSVPAAAQRAQKSLAKKEVREAASPAVQVLLELRRATTCDQKHAAIVHAETAGDERALPLMAPLGATRGCGFAGFKDCWPCLRDGSLGRAQTAIKARAKAP
jgi:serine/threonine-protein kinase